VRTSIAQPFRKVACPGRKLESRSNGTKTAAAISKDFTEPMNSDTGTLKCGQRRRQCHFRRPEGLRH